MKARSLALVCAGPISRASLGRVPHLGSRLGPVKSGTLQRASRAANSLGGGIPVSEYHELNHSRTILVSVPDDQLPVVVAELATEVAWKHKVAILCNSRLDSSALASLENLGAGVGSFDAINGFDGRYVIEGSRSAIREMRTLLQHGTARAVEIRRGTKRQYLAGVDISTSLLTSMLVAAVKSFREAGVPLKQAHDIAAKLAGKSLRDYLKAGVGGAAATPGIELQALREGLELANPGLLQRFKTAKPE
jgi:predicted short-subunit dehydrogenase-like oxidoreductase (DUF2520 family)